MRVDLKYFALRHLPLVRALYNMNAELEQFQVRHLPHINNPKTYERNDKIS